MKIVYSYYVADILHRGHILMMKNAKAIAGEDGKLIIGVLTDKATMEKKPKPTMSFDERMMLVEAIKYADVVVAQETYSPLPNVRRIKPDVLMESTSHDPNDVKRAEETVKEWGGKVICLPYLPDLSSSAIKQRIRKGGKDA